MPTTLLGLVVLSGALALGSLFHFVASWRDERGKRSPNGATVSLGSRMCLVCRSFAVLVKTADWAMGGEFAGHTPPALLGVVGFLTHGPLFAAAAGVFIAAIGATAWLIR